jgi:hypothetical protein
VTAVTLTAQLKALVLGVWMAIHPGPLPADAEIIADALVGASLQRADEAPALGSPALDLVAEAVWVEHESGIQREPHPESWDARARVSCGPLQEPCDFVRTHSLRDQASRWLQLLRWGKSVCPESPAAPLSSGSCARCRRLADGRIGKSRELLVAWLNPGEE